MKHKQSNHALYTNLPDERSNALQNRVVRNLTELHSVKLPPGLSWAEIEQKHQEHLLVQKKGKNMQQSTAPEKKIFLAPRRQLSFPRRWTIAAAVMLVTILLTAAAVVTPQLRNLFNQNSQTQRVLNQFSELHQSQTVDGATVQLEAVYADANLAIIGYSITTAEKDVSASFTATTPQGLALSEFTGVGGYDNWSALGSKETNATYFIAFNTSDILSAPQELTLHLTGEVTQGNISQAKLGQKPQVLGNLSFDVSATLHKGKILTPHQSVTIHGRTAMLERVVITPTMTSIFVSGFTENNPGQKLVYLVEPDSLVVQNKSYKALSSSPDETQDNGTWVLLYTNNLSQQHGTWKLTVVGEPNVLGTQELTTWTFQFSVS